MILCTSMIVSHLHGQIRKVSWNIYSIGLIKVLFEFIIWCAFTGLILYSSYYSLLALNDSNTEISFLEAWISLALIRSVIVEKPCNLTLVQSVWENCQLEMMEEQSTFIDLRQEQQNFL